MTNIHKGNMLHQVNHTNPMAATSGTCMTSIVNVCVRVPVVFQFVAD